MSFPIVYIFQTIKCTHFGQYWGSRLRGTWVSLSTSSFIHLLPFPFPHRHHPQSPFEKKLLLPLSYHSVFSPLFHLVQPVCLSFFPVPALPFCPCQKMASITECCCITAAIMQMHLFYSMHQKSHSLCQGQNTLYCWKCTRNTWHTGIYSAHLNFNYITVNVAFWHYSAILFLSLLWAVIINPYSYAMSV